MKQISFRQYRAIDLAILSVILFAAEMITVKAAGEWFPDELYTLSPTAAVICIVMMRWNGYAVFPAIAGGAAYCLALGASLPYYAVYCAGNCFALIAMLLFRISGKEKVREKPVNTLIFTAAAYVGVCLGRGLGTAVIGGKNVFDAFVSFLTADSLSLVFSAVVVLLARNIDGLFEDQKAYLIRTEAERRRAQSPDPFDDSL